MDDFEQELARALERQEAPAGFSARVLARINAAQRTPTPHRTWRLAFAAVLVIASFVGAFRFDSAQQQEVARGEAARQQVMLALRIAGSKMQIAQKQIEQFSEKGGREE